MSLVYLCCGIISLSILRLMNAERVLTDWNTGDGGFKWRSDCDFTGLDIGQITITTATREECGLFCIANPECSHFTIDTYFWNCYMKKAPSTTVLRDLDYGSIGNCGFIPWRLDSETGRDGWNSSSESDVNKCRFYGNDKVVITTDCQQVKDCSLWYDQVLPTNGSACKLIDGTSGSCCPAHINKMNAENVPTDWNTGKFGVKWQSNCDFYGDDIGSIQISFEQQIRDSSGKLTEEQCSGWCVANPQCSHFRLHEQICFMKKKPLNSQHTSINSGLCGFVPWRFDSASVFLESSDWKQNGVNCEIYGNDNLIYTTQCRESLRCTDWYENVRPTYGSTDCKLVDGSSGSCCPEIPKKTQKIKMIPDEKEKIINAGTTLTLRCDYAFEDVFQKNNFNFSWEIPDFLAKNVDLSDLDNRLRKTFGRNETHMTSTLSLANTRPKDTGYFGCRGPRGYPNTFTVKQYVYVFSSAELVIIEDNEYYIDIPHGKTDHPINCRPTHPDIEVSLIHRHQYTARGDNKLEPKSDLLADPNSNWSFEPETGLKLKKAKIDDSGHFECTGTYETQEYSRDIYLYVGGMELNRTDGVGDPVEGSNVNLMCRTYVYTASFSPPKWSYQINGNGQMRIIDETNPFEGIEIKEPDIFVYKDKTLYTSQLSLPNISPSTYRFQCQGSVFTENISFQVKELNGNLKYKFVQLEKNISHNLTCISRGSKGNRIIWLKDGKEYSGQVYSDNISSFLPLQGKAEEKGSYACLWKNNLVGENYVNFTVLPLLQFEEIPPIDKTVVIAVSTTFAVLIFILIVSIGVKFYFDKKRRVSQEALIRLLKGNVDQLKKQSPIEEQIEFLPYDKRWEFPRNRLKLGIQLGAGCFGRVVKAEAVGLKDSEETVKTVAVKMVRSGANIAAMEALIGELKILIYLGSHLNVVNLLGACTKQIHKGELLVTVEYCRFGSLQTFLISHRNNFINLVDDFGNLKTQGEMESNNIARPNVGEPSQQASDPSGMNSSTEILDVSAIDFNQHNLEADFNRPISTTDLISWSFQIARGMDYLVSKKVLHGDLAARNILLADDGVAKVADFGMARKMYYEENYEKSGQGLMPVKWMAIESLTDRIFSSQSDMWSYGILLWELFSLGKVPYPGMDVGHILMKEILNGYRMEKPAFAPNIFGEMMANCWKTDPKERPTFSQLEEIICGQLESSVTSDYLNMNALYEKLNEERENATPKEHFGLAKLLREKSRAQPANEEKSRYSSFPMRFSKRDANEDLSF